MIDVLVSCVDRVVRFTKATADAQTCSVTMLVHTTGMVTAACMNGRMSHG